jgi:uncharacterized YccA/Bax inhibitor family protein
MALFQSGNPTLTDKIFDRNRATFGDMQGTMTVRGTMNKFGFLMLMVLGAAAYTWQLYYQNNPSLMTTLMWVGAIGGLVVGLAISFKPNWSSYLAPVYGILEGFFVGALSAVLNDAYAEKFPGLIISAVGLTLGVAIAMFLLYNFRIIKPTERFKSILLSATVGIGIFYLICMVMRLFHVDIPFMNFGDNSLLGIGISLFIVAIAALNLILDFERIEVGAETGSPKFMEWYCAFGLLVTIVWLYIEILRLLSRFSSRN